MTQDLHVKLTNVGLDYPVFGASKVKSDAGSSDQPGPTTGMGNLVLAGRKPKYVRALQDINIDLEPGDRLAIVGRNGSGKTTLLRVIAGIYEPTSGIVDVQGRISTLFAMGMGMRPQSSGYRNIVLQAMIAGLSKKEAVSIIEDVKQFTELGDFLNLPVNSYSQGMAMRLKFAVATAISPDILIMDEWVGAGDSEFQKKATKRMNSVFSGSGIAILASHNNRLLKETCNKAIWLESGRLKAGGNVDDVIEMMLEQKKQAAKDRRNA